MIKPLAAVAVFAMATASMAADKIQVLASFSILGGLVRLAGSDRVTVLTVVGPDEDAHVFEPRALDAKNLLQTRLLVTNGLGFEPWAQKLVKSAGYKGAVVVASQDVKTRNMPAEKGKSVETDPHAWQDPTSVLRYVRDIAAALGKLDPAGTSVYQANSEAYAKELQALDAEAKMAQLSKDAGVNAGTTLYVDALSKPAGPADSYLDLMRHNVSQLVDGMKQN